MIRKKLFLEDIREHLSHKDGCIYLNGTKLSSFKEKINKIKIGNISYTHAYINNNDMICVIYEEPCNEIVDVFRLCFLGVEKIPLCGVVYAQE